MPAQDTLHTYLDPSDVQIQDTGHQEADAEHQQEQDSHTPRTEVVLSLWVGEVCLKGT